MVVMQADRREASLLAELQHRVRNTLATTRLIVRRSAETSASLEDYVAHLEGRLGALARVQNAAIRDPLAGIDLGMLVSDEMTGAGLKIGSRLDLVGGQLLLHPRAAETFALAIHELTANAIKFGAFAHPDGSLRIAWHVKDGDARPASLMFNWVESGLRLPEGQEIRSGFGNVVLHEMMRHNLEATAMIAITASGLTCRISLPLTERVLPAAAKP